MPLTTSFTVPSPPAATTRSKPASAADRASSIAWPRYSVERQSTCQPRVSHSARARLTSAMSSAWPARGLRIIRADLGSCVGAPVTPPPRFLLVGERAGNRGRANGRPRCKGLWCGTWRLLVSAIGYPLPKRFGRIDKVFNTHGLKQTMHRRERQPNHTGI